MKVTKHAIPDARRKMFVTRTDALFLMVASSAAAVTTTAFTVTGIVDSSAGQVTLTLPELIGVNGHVPGESYLFSLDFNAAPLVLGIALLLVAGVFQFGRRLQKDTEGLI